MTGQRSTSPFVRVPSALPVDGWRSACGPDGGNCVEVNLAARDAAGIIGIRDSKPATGPALVFRASGWQAFLAGTVTGRYHA
ncbi:MAG TPA: DUF397 domain-containing protein [Pseudonocardiaceae bacterium]